MGRWLAASPASAEQTGLTNGGVVLTIACDLTRPYAAESLDNMDVATRTMDRLHAASASTD